MVAGIIGIYLTIRSETLDENSLSGRALYGFILVLAGMLAEAVRSSQSTISAADLPVGAAGLSNEVKSPSPEHKPVPDLSESAIEMTR